jgi:hypothetical protein
MKPSVYLFLLLLVLSGCSLFELNSSSPEDPTANDLVELDEGETSTLPSFNAALTFNRKTEDSRCPIDVTCVWAGEATVLLTLTVEGQAPASFSITTPQAPDQTVDEEGFPVKDTLDFRFTLLDLSPYPDSRILNPGPSVVTLRVEKP